MYWERGLHMYKASAVVPTGYVRVGNTAPLVGEDTQRYASFWGDGYDVYRQLRWQKIPEKQRKAFKKAAKSKKTVMFAGREYGISKQNLSDVWDDFEDAMELKAFPCLSSLFLTKWHKNLY
ncbi:TPA: gliding motility protein, partial [Neisseria meningitidis]